MNYPIMTLPFYVKEFSDLSKEETDKYFDWFMTEIPYRLKVFKDFFLSFVENEDVFDYSVNSLNIIWKWYLKNVVIQHVDKKEYEEELKKTPIHMRKYIPTKELGGGWTQIAWDIGIYFCLCLLEYSPLLRWGVETEPAGLLTINRPAIIGFLDNDSFEPFYTMMVVTGKIVKGNYNENALSNLFNVWIENAPRK